MKNIPSFEEFINENRTSIIDEIFILLDKKVDIKEIENVLFDEIEEGIFDNLFKNIFVNPRKKREIKKLEDQLVKVNVELTKLLLQGDKISALEDDLFDAAKPMKRGSSSFGSSSRGKSSYGKSSYGSSGDSPFDIKQNALEDQKEAIEAKMDLIAGEDEKLQKYVEAKKLEARMKANELTIKLADSEESKILKKLIDKEKKEIKDIGDELEE